MASTEPAKAAWSPPAAELVITLDRPTEHAGQSYSELRLREPTSGEMRQIRAKDALDQQIFAVSLIAGVPSHAVEKMPISAIERAENYLMGFIPPARWIGET